MCVCVCLLFIFIYLAVLGLSCSREDVCCCIQELCWGMRDLVLRPGIEPTQPALGSQES